ncbi:hypothetical protein KR222_003885, partial [Zaprionus bogoriensis]
LLLLVSLASLADSTPSFGFDSANSCSPNGKMSRRGRAQMLAAIPCDLAKQPFCHLPGSIYPWHAVRRFVHENQGLMKRMYGDVRHISILRDEIQNNEVVDSDDIEEAAERYSKTPRGAKFMLHERDEFSTFKGNDVLMEPHFRPMSTTSTTSSSSTSTTTSTPATSTSTASAPGSSSSTSTTTTTTIAPPVVAVAQPELQLEQNSPLEVEEVERPSLESNSVYELPVVPTTTTTSSSSSTTTTTTRPSVGDNIQIIESPQLGTLQAVPAALRNLTIDAPVKPTTAPPSKRTTTMPVRKRKPSDSATPAILLKAAPSASTTTSTSNDFNSTTGSTTIALLQRRNITKSALGSTTPVSFASLFSSTYTALSSDKLRRPQAPGTTSSSTTTAPPISTTSKSGLLREGQLFQDAMKQEPMTVTSNMRGVNACPVKDEVVAPFWANNTRGEVLALLNLYPFEQYVHWEKCTHEFKQMFCRDGCRCEQQYRLHRLLAYDPHNECRGIFSDWFRFPSSCICKCYNIPMDFRATSRSPRSESSFDAPQSPAHHPPPPAVASDPIGAAEAVVQRAIYEHATDQWYRPRDEFDFFEG